MIYLIMALMLLTGCEALTPAMCQDDLPGTPYRKILDDKFAFYEFGQPKYIIQRRGYTQCSAVTIKEWTVTREQFEDPNYKVPEEK